MEDQAETMDTKSAAVLGNFQLSAQLPNGQTLAFTGYVFDGESKEAVEDRVDIFQDIIARQRARCEVPELEARLDMALRNMRSMHDTLSELETKKDGGVKLTAQERQTINNLRVNMRHADEEIEKGKKSIDETKKKAGMA